MPEEPTTYLTVGQVARRAGKKRAQIQHLCDVGRLPCVRNEYGVRLISAADVERLCARPAPATTGDAPRIRTRGPRRVVTDLPPLFHLLRDQGRSQKWLADRLGVPEWRMSRYRRGLGQLDANLGYHLLHLMDAAELLGVPHETIMRSEEVRLLATVDPVGLYRARPPYDSPLALSASTAR